MLYTYFNYSKNINPFINYTDRQYLCYMLLLCNKKEGYERKQKVLSGFGYDPRNIIYREHIDTWNTFKIN